MTSYEIGSNSSRYPYDYSFVTDGTNSEYTDTTESNFILPTITGADADKFLQVNAQATGYEYTAVDAELPPQAGQAGKFLETNGTSVFWDTVNQVPGITGGVAGQYLTNNGSTASWGVISQLPGVTGGVSNYLLTNNGSTALWTDAPVLTSLVTSGNITFSNNNSQFSQLRRNDNVNIILQDDGSGTRTMTFNLGNVSTTRRRLFIQQGTFTVENSKFVVSDSSQIHSIAGVLNLSTAGSASAPTLMFGDNADTPVASRSGIWGTNDVIRFGTDGTERVTIRNDGLTVPDGSTAAPSYSFENSTNSGLVRTLVGTDNGIGFVANGTQVCSVVGGNFRLSGGASIRNNVSNPSSNIQFVGGTGGATGYIQLSFSDSSTGTSATYRLGNGTNWPATETVMSRLVGGTGTNEIFATEHGNTYFRFLGATGTGANLPTRVQRVEINNSGMSITGDLSVSGRATIPDVVYPFDVFTSSGSTADFTLAQNTRSNVRLEMDTNNTILRFPALVEGTFYRIVPFRNGTTATLSFRPGNSVIMYMYSGGSRSQVTGNAGGTNGINVLPGTFYECIFSSGAWYIVAQHPIANCALPADVSVGGNLTVTGTISGSISTPQVVKRTFVIGATSSAAYVYDSGNTAPATTLISNSIQSTKNITLGNMGASYDGFEFEFMLTGDLNNFGVAVTLSLAGSFVKVRSGAIGVDGSTAGQVHTFSRPMNEFRITGVFVWNGGTNPYWVVIDRGVYKQRATNDIFAGGTAAYEVTRNTPEDLLVTRASNTTIDFTNLVTKGGSQEDYDGFNFWLSTDQSATGKLSFKNSLSVAILIYTAGGVTTINAGTTVDVYAAGVTGRCHRCVFRNNAGFKWFIYAM